MLAATLFAPAGVAQTTSPDLVPRFSAATRAWRAPDLEPAVRGRNPVRGFLAPKPGSAERFSKKQFFVLSATVYGASLADMHQTRSEEHTSELQSLRHLVCRLLLEKNKSKVQLMLDSTKAYPQAICTRTIRDGSKF